MTFNTLRILFRHGRAFDPDTTTMTSLTHECSSSHLPSSRQFQSLATGELVTQSSQCAVQAPRESKVQPVAKTQAVSVVKATPKVRKSTSSLPPTPTLSDRLSVIRQVRRWIPSVVSSFEPQNGCIPRKYSFIVSVFISHSNTVI